MAPTAARAALLTLAAGCATTAPAQQYSEALGAWDARQYARALATAREARDAAEKANDTEVRDKSSYLVGLAAYQLGRMDDASRSFAQVAEGTDRPLAGKATAMLGAIAIDQSRWSDAVTLYSRAADMLTGTDATEARALASAAQARLPGTARAGSGARGTTGGSSGVTATAKSAGSNAASSGTAGTDRRTPPAGAPRVVEDDTRAGESTAPPQRSTPSATSVLTIVAGTYSSEVAARQRATTLAEPARKAGLATPRVVPASAPERRVWIVEVGAFQDKASAEAALRKLPVTGCVVAPSQVR